MNVYVFGNEDCQEDNLVFKVVKKLQGKIKDVQFVVVEPNEDLPFTDENQVIIIDTAQGINKVEILSESDLDKLISSPKGSVHDFDLNFQLKYLKKLGRLKKIKIIALPYRRKINYPLIQAILRKLVAQDMQGS